MTAPALELSSITKRFGGVAAVQDVSLALAPGEVLALVGENGAGKSTLIQVACGLYRPDEGEVRLGGQRLPAGDPAAAIRAGLGTVHQHFMLVPPLRVWETVVLGQEPRRAGLWGALGLLDRARSRAEVAQAAQAARFELDVDARVDSLSVAQQQRVEILKQLWRGAQVLILDEPTAVLAPPEAEELVAAVRRLADAGRSVLFVSHKLREVLAVADRVAVLRRGRLTLTAMASELTEAALGEAAVGSAAFAGPVASPLRPTASSSAPRGEGLVMAGLSAEGRNRRGTLRDLKLTVRPGEIVGVAGVDGNGQAELSEVLAGLRPAQGSLRLNGAPGLSPRGWATAPALARAQGVVGLPEDRQARALCGALRVDENVALGWHRAAPFARGGRIDVEGRRARAAEVVSALDVRPPRLDLSASMLSGGNQQKLVVGRELFAGPAPVQLVVAMHPSRGLDVGAAARVHAALRQVAAAGAAVLVLSLDLDELRGLSQRLAVLCEGRIVAEVAPQTEDRVLGELLLGHAPPAHSAATAGNLHG